MLYAGFRYLKRSKCRYLAGFALLLEEARIFRPTRTCTDESANFQGRGKEISEEKGKTGEQQGEGTGKERTYLMALFVAAFFPV